MLNGARLWLSLDSRAVRALRLRRGLLGPRLEAFEQVALPAAAHEPSPSGPTLREAEAVRQAAARALAGVAARAGERACLLLPDGLARLALLDVPAGVEPTQFARFRLGPLLPFTPSETVYGCLPLAGHWYVAAGLRRGLVEAYEGLARSLGLSPSGVFLASLAALEGSRRQGWREALLVLLGDTTLLLVVLRTGRVVGLRHLLRSEAGEPAWLQAEGQRSLAAALLPEQTPWWVAGHGARAVVHALAVGGLPARLAETGLAGAPEMAEELAWLRGLPA